MLHANALRRWQTSLSKRLSQFSFSLSLSLLSAIGATPALSADRIAFSYPPFGEFYLSVESLERFARDGTITDEFEFYAQRLEPEQREKVRSWLKTRFDLPPVTLAQFTYTPLGETLLIRLGNAIGTPANQNGFYALRSALILAAADSDGLTLVNLLRKFPIKTIKIDFAKGSQIVEELSGAFEDKAAILAAIRQQAEANASNSPPQSNAGQQLDLRLPGTTGWRKEHFTFHSPHSNHSITVDIYRPNELTGQLTPAIVISHGIGSDRQTFAYLAEHLASYGFFVAVPEHPDVDAYKMYHFLTGLDTAPEPTVFINQPLQITDLLDELSDRYPSVNLEQVGVIGQSFGAYAALASGGAKINGEELRQVCPYQTSLDISFNLSQLLQCQITDLPNIPFSLQDRRVKAVIAVNPLTSRIFGREGLSQLQIPVMILANSNDVLTPMLAEQIGPFTRLETANKYLAVMERGTHFSFIGGEGVSTFPIPTELVGPRPELAYPYLTALSTAFFKTYIAGDLDYQSYLSESYVKSISQASFNLYLLKAFKSDRD
jgi:predicted dienelactone hydrolase